MVAGEHQFGCCFLGTKRLKGGQTRYLIVHFVSRRWGPSNDLHCTHGI